MIAPARWLLAALVLNEVLYDPPGADGGREFVELLHVGSAPLVLTDVTLEVGDGARPGTWRSVWRAAGESLSPGVPWVIGGDSLGLRDATLQGTLQNGPDAVRLVRDGVVIDLLGYGADLDRQLFESRPAPDVAGQSLARIPDGIDHDDNARDWHAAPPSPGRRNLPERDVALRLAPPDPTRLWPFRQVRLTLHAHNRGRIALVRERAVRTWLRPLPGEPYLDGFSPGTAETLGVAWIPALAAGDSVGLAVRWLARAGLFQIEAALGVGDENPDNDHDLEIVRVGSGDVVVHEILFAPLPGDVEWIELHNRGTRTHDLYGWTFADATGKRVAVEQHAPLAPGGFLVVSADTLDAIAQLPPGAARAGLSPWPSLNNRDGPEGEADRIVVRDPRGLVQDAVFYRAAWGPVRGRSIERLTADADARGLLWAPSKDALGATPGRANSASAPPAHAVGLRLQPNPFSPDADGFDDLLTLAFEVPHHALGFEASVFDVEGRRRRWLAADRLGPGPRRLVWDGTDDRGHELPEGVYVLRLELLGSGSPDTSQLRCIGLVRGAVPHGVSRRSP